MLKFEGIAQIGDKIRAYDFEPMEGRADRYVEGTVQTIVEAVRPYGYKAFAIVVSVDTDLPIDNEFYYASEYSRIGKFVYVPMETSMDYDDRVTKIN